MICRAFTIIHTCIIYIYCKYAVRIFILKNIKVYQQLLVYLHLIAQLQKMMHRDVLHVVLQYMFKDSEAF